MRLSYKYFCRGAVWVGFLFSVAFVTRVGAGDWPQWRGPMRNDISAETGLLRDWPSGGPPLVWKATGLGNSYATVSVVGDRIYTAGDQATGNFVVALNAADGKQVWAAKLGKPGDLGGYHGPRAVPTVNGDLLFSMDQWGDLVCFERATGLEKWRKDLVKDFNGSRPNWGFAEAPLVDGDKVVVTPGGSKGAVAALDKKTGAVIWRSEEFKDPPHYSSLTIAEIGGVRQYIQLTASSVVGVAAADGKLLWRAVRNGSTAVIPTPIEHEGFVYVTSGYGNGCNLFEVTATGGKFAVREIYANKVMVNHHGGVVKVGDFIYGYSDSKGWTCQDFKTGVAKWQEKEKLGKGSLVFADGRFYLRTEDKSTVVLIEASPLGYKEHGRFTPPDLSGKETWPHPVVANGRLYLRDQDVLLCYDVQGK
jgi:outer membrane protein assembly factor BamB